MPTEGLEGVYKIIMPFFITFNNIINKCQLTHAYLIPFHTQMLFLLGPDLDNANRAVTLQGPLALIVEYHYLLHICYNCIILNICFHLV